MSSSELERSTMTKKKTTNTVSSSAELVGNSEDLLREILVNIPAKSLIRFKMVSKQWRFLISSPSFCLYHTRSFPTKHTLKPSALFIDAFCFPTSESRFFSLTRDCVRLPRFDFIDFPNFIIVQSCAGLLLCVSNSGSGPSTYFICNPTTRSLKMLCFPDCYSNLMWFDVNLAFDPIKSIDYKIVVVRPPELTGPGFIDIYSSETNSWSLSKVEFRLTVDTGYDHGVFFKGAIYWPNDYGDSQYFDVENECLKTIPMPDIDDAMCRYLGESGGHLKLAIAHQPCPLFSYSVFEMAKDNSHWYLKYGLKLDINDSSLSPEIGGYQLFCAIESKEEGNSLFAIAVDGEGISYNLKDRKLESLVYPKLEFHQSPPSWVPWCPTYLGCRACQFIETLSPI